MSYDISLVDKDTGKMLKSDVGHNMKGATYQVGKTKNLWLSVTYNYADHYYKVFDGDKGIRTIHGMTGAESMPVLEDAISKLGDSDKPKRGLAKSYWNSTEENAKTALQYLLRLAKMGPNGVWNVN